MLPMGYSLCYLDILLLIFIFSSNIYYSIAKLIKYIN